MVLTICPACEAKGGIKVKSGIGGINIDGTMIEIDHSWYVCTKCRKEFDDPQEFGDFFAKAYLEYEKITGIKITRLP